MVLAEFFFPGQMCVTWSVCVFESIKSVKKKSTVQFCCSCIIKCSLINFVMKQTGGHVVTQ